MMLAWWVDWSIVRSVEDVVGQLVNQILVVHLTNLATSIQDHGVRDLGEFP